MCKVSDKIKFCSCAATSTRKLINYWVLFRFDKNKNLMLLGEALLNYSNKDMLQYNNTSLLKRLSEPDAFDFDIQPKENDRLLISLKCKEHFRGNYKFGFEFINNKWQVCGYDLIEWVGRHNEAEFGKVKSKFIKN